MPRKTKAEPNPSVDQWPVDYDQPDYSEHARLTFLKAIEKVAPAVLQSLHHDVFPVFHDVISGNRLELSAVLNPHLYLYSCDAPAIVCWDLQPAVFAWAERFHLNGRPGTNKFLIARWRPYKSFAEPPPLWLTTALSDWIQPIVVRTLAHWSSAPQPPDLVWNLKNITDDTWLTLKKPPDSLELRVDGWDPEVESEAAFKKRALQAFEEYMIDYCAICRELVSKKHPIDLPADFLQKHPKMQTLVGLANKIVRPKLKRLPERYAPHHFEWLAMYQCMAMSRSEIARKVRSDRRVVSEGINRGAQLVVSDSYEKWLLEPRPGRPRKSE